MDIKSPGLPFLTYFMLFLCHWFIHLCTRHDGSINRRLLSLADFKTSAPATKLINNTPVSTSDITVDPSHNLCFRLFHTHSRYSLPLIIYFHGGGFQFLGPVPYDRFCTHLAAKVPAVVVSVNYRLAPEHKFPSQYEDGFDVFKFIDAECSNFLPANTDLGKCFIGGDSAGGNIAHHVAIKALQNGEQFRNMRIVGIIQVQPFFGGEERIESELRLTKAPLLNVKLTDILWREFLPEGSDKNHPAANVFGGGENSEAAAAVKNLDFLKSLVIVGGNDLLQDHDRRYVDWLKNCGKQVEMSEYPNAFHGFFLFPDTPEFAFLIDDVANFVQKQVTSSWV